MRRRPDWDTVLFALLSLVALAVLIWYQLFAPR
jgi:hypothetical protein